MADMLEYLKWRGDIRFSQLSVNPVDALIFSTLSYLRFDGIVPEDPYHQVPLKDAAAAFFSLPDPEKRCRSRRDLDLLRAAAETVRFGSVGLSFYRSVLIPEEETQFAAVTYFLEDLSAFLAFRGTDSTLVGWKEDFNMTFQEIIPAQRLAKEYTEQLAAASNALLRLGGHSKGGNLAVYAAAKCDPAVQARILEVHNQDGPGFSKAMMEDPGYRKILPIIRSYVPQSSVIGMLLEHEEPYIIVRSSQFGIMQHDPHTWEVLGGNFVLVEELTADSRFLDRTFKAWLAGMTNEERNAFFDTVFDLLAAGGASVTSEIMRPQNVRAYFKTLQTDEKMRHVIGSELESLMESARAAYLQNKEEK